MHVCMPSRLSRILLFGTPWTVALPAPLSTGFSRQEYWSGLPCPPPGESPRPGDWTRVSCGSCIAGGFFSAEPLGRSRWSHTMVLKRRQLCDSPKGLELTQTSIISSSPVLLIHDGWAAAEGCLLLDPGVMSSDLPSPLSRKGVLRILGIQSVHRAIVSLTLLVTILPGTCSTAHSWE